MVKPVPHAPEKLWIFNRGHALHEFIQKPLGKSEQEIFIRTEFNGFNVIGFIDAIHENILYELKTTANIPVEPQTHHTLQVQGYYSMLSPEKQASISKILIVYISLKDIKTFEVPKRNVLPFLEAKAAVLAHALSKKLPPARQLGWWCDFCDHKDLCFATGTQPTKQQTLKLI
jgi:CRISPR/Cas system-associated exonuclease Cas4 (RecB family)